MSKVVIAAMTIYDGMLGACVFCGYYVDVRSSNAVGVQQCPLTSQCMLRRRGDKTRSQSTSDALQTMQRQRNFGLGVE